MKNKGLQIVNTLTKYNQLLENQGFLPEECNIVVHVIFQFNKEHIKYL